MDWKYLAQHSFHQHHTFVTIINQAQNLQRNPPATAPGNYAKKLHACFRVAN